LTVTLAANLSTLVAKITILAIFVMIVIVVVVVTG
jgi:hypothetical protein